MQNQKNVQIVKVDIGMIKMGKGLGWSKGLKRNWSIEHKNKLRIALKKAREKRIADGKQKPWTKEDLNYLRDYYGIIPTKIIAQKLGRSIYYIYTKMFKEGKHVSKDYLSKIRLGEKHPNWKGGERNSNGYILVYQPTHPYKDKQGYVLKHRLIMENHIGRYLTKKERVHHIDINNTNNKIENLYLFQNEAEHQNYHRFLKKLVLTLINTKE